ncbi:MAG: phosphoglucosamine mutase [Clostridia bacterium]|nr:phosphoglucosamine mutase [Clostridia bacterium]
MGKYFGTDGFRGIAGKELTAIHAFRIGQLLGYYLKNEKKERPKAVIGKDTRISSYMLEYAIASGLASVGADSYLLHVTTTPSVAYVTKSDKFDIGIMISASHNPYYDNGIKILNSSGEKINDTLTDKIEKYLDARDTVPLAENQEIGKIVDYYEGRNRYIGYLISIAKSSFKKFRVGLDLANGSCHMIGKTVFESLGATTYVINNQPNGLNINENAGSTHIENLQKLVKEKGLDIGFAFDGDGDRCICVDDKGEIVNGDKIMYLLAKDLKEKGELLTNTVVTTVMSNLGLYKSLEKESIKYEITSVGDRFVYENIAKNGHSLGGEESGHIILSKYASTGDGILTAIKIMDILADKKQNLSYLLKDITLLPQKTLSIAVKNKKDALDNEKLQMLCKTIEKELKNNGRILLRASGTEPKIRVMIECESEAQIDNYLNRINSVIQEEKLNG